MKKIFASLFVALLSTAALAQVTPEAVVSMCPDMPSDGNIAQFCVTGKNDQVEKYFRLLGEAGRMASKAAAQQYENKNFKAEQRNMEKKQKQMLNKAAARQAAGQKMMKFLQTLTPAQRKKFESFRNEADAMQYLASIGKMDELADLMRGLEGADADDQIVSPEQMEEMGRDLTAEMAVVNEEVFKAETKLNEFAAGFNERAANANNEAIKANSDGPGMGGAWDIDAVKEAMTAFYMDEAKKWKKLLQDYMLAIKNTIPVMKMYDDQQNARRKMTGQNKLSALESAAFSSASLYLSAASKILPGGNITEGIEGNPSPQELMEDRTQEINSMK